MPPGLPPILPPVFSRPSFLLHTKHNHTGTAESPHIEGEKKKKIEPMGFREAPRTGVSSYILSKLYFGD